NLDVGVSDTRPGHRMRELKRSITHASQPARRAEQLEQRVAQSRVILAGKKAAAAVGKQSLRVPVGRRHNRRSRTHRVRKCAACGLRLVEIWAHEDIGGLQIPAEFIVWDELATG